MKKIFAMVLVLMMVLVSAASAESFTFKMGIDAEYPPYSYIDDNGDYAGYDVEMCKAVCYNERTNELLERRDLFSCTFESAAMRWT